MTEVQYINYVLTRILTGEIKVKWKEWFFSGGKTYGNGDSYTLIDQNGKTTGEIVLNDMNGISIYDAFDETPCFEYKDDRLEKMVDIVLYRALKRDDRELCSLLTDQNGEFIGLPRDYGDISREDVLTGKWNVSERSFS